MDLFTSIYEISDAKNRFFIDELCKPIQNTEDLSKSDYPLVIIEDFYSEWDDGIHYSTFNMNKSNIKNEDKRAEQHLIIKNNQRFKIKIFIPPSNFLSKKTEGYKFENILIMINGFAESSSHIYDQIGYKIAKKGIPCIFLPFPFHFSRHILFKKFRRSNKDSIDPFCISSKDAKIFSQLIFQSFYANPFLFNTSIAQLYEDLSYIEKETHSKKETDIEKVNSKFLNFYCDENTKISLFGYSLGGLMSLCGAFADVELNETNRKFHNIILLESGTCLDQVQVNNLLSRRESTCRSLYRYYISDKNKFSHHESFFYEGNEFEKRNKIQFDLFFPIDKISREFIVKEKEIIRRYKNETGKDFNPLTELEKDNYIMSLFSNLLKRSPTESNEIWEDILKRLYNHAYEADMRKALKGWEKSYMQVIFSNEILFRKETLQKLSSNLLIIVGGADDIFPLTSILKLSPDTGIALFQIPGITHYLKFGSTKASWEAWEDYTISTIISSFIQTDLVKN